METTPIESPDEVEEGDRVLAEVRKTPMIVTETGENRFGHKSIQARNQYGWYLLTAYDGGEWTIRVNGELEDHGFGGIGVEKVLE